jgi:predicted nuclease with TOPRIM domain
MSNEWLDLGPRLEAENKTMRDELRSLRKEVSQLKASISHLESEVRSRR